MSFSWDIIGHEKTLRQLDKKLESGTLGHAILFAGPQNIGKFSILQKLARRLQEGVTIDTIEIKDDGSSIKIEQTRDIIARLSMTPQSPCKILLLENIDRIVPEAANSLLKILEEPTEKTYFFFTVESLRDVLETIQSRMQIFQLTEPPKKNLIGFLKNRYPDVNGERLSQIETISLGKPGKAISFIETPELFEKSLEQYNFVKRFCASFSLTNRFAFIQKIHEDPAAVRDFLKMTAVYLRNLLFSGAAFEKETACRMLPKTVQAYQLAKRNVNRRLLLEDLVVSWPTTQ